MWGVYPVPPRPFLPIIPRPTQTLVPYTISATPQPSSGASFSPRQKQEQDKQTQHEEKGGNQLRGLDVLWAMQRASEEKKRVKKKKKKNQCFVSAGSQSQREEKEDLEYSNVRALCIKREWSVKLDELERRLQELSETK